MTLTWEPKMPDNDSEPDTDAAPTEQGSTETTELDSVKDVGQVQAWSVDDTNELEPDEPRRVSLLSVGLVALVVVVAGALVFLATTLFNSHRSKPVEPKPQPTTTAPVAAPPPPALTVTATPPPIVTVTAQPAPTSTVAAAPTSVVTTLSDTDEAFLEQMKGGGMSIPTLDAAETTVTEAHQVCAYRANHDDATTAKYAASLISWAVGANPATFTEMAEFHYCGQYLPAGY